MVRQPSFYRNSGHTAAYMTVFTEFRFMGLRRMEAVDKAAPQDGIDWMVDESGLNRWLTH